MWFVAPFIDNDGQEITAEVIRSRLGNFDKVIRCPARYGARLSQAFTSTDVSISIEAEEICQIPDIVKMSDRGLVIFTDGVGACSRSTMDAIANALETRSALSKKKRKRYSSFSAVQIRLAGIKGVLAVDYKLSGDAINVRPSMDKFKYLSTSLDVEVADVFNHAKSMFLNRPLIMILETLGVPIQTFVHLQQAVITSVTTAVNRLESSAKLMTDYGLGSSFRIPSVLSSLARRGLVSPPPDDDFLNRALNYAANDILRSLKQKCRIRVPNSWTLVGVADTHFYLKEGEIFGAFKDRRRRLL